ncbi:MAG: hypothetical protein EXR75_12765 [Myxococcales bacterium]|nr:hypothetical protein [Myxococcales bacterium]
MPSPNRGHRYPHRFDGLELLMRVTENMRLIGSQRALFANAERAHRLSEQASSGVVISRPSDGPAIYSSIVRRGDHIARLESRQKTLGRAADDLILTETALTFAGDIIARAREMAVQLADGGVSGAHRAVAAKEVALMRQELVSIANSKGQRGYLFSGTATSTPAFDNFGNFQGTTQPMEVEYSDNQRMPVTIDGFTAFKNLDVFGVLTQLETDLLADNPAGVRAGIDTLDLAHVQIVSARADAGSRTMRIHSIVDVTANAATTASSQQSEQQSGDLTKTILKLQEAQSAYERSVAITRQVLTIASAVERF